MASINLLLVVSEQSWYMTWFIGTALFKMKAEE